LGEIAMAGDAVLHLRAVLAQIAGLRRGAEPEHVIPVAAATAQSQMRPADAPGGLLVLQPAQQVVIGGMRDGGERSCHGHALHLNFLYGTFMLYKSQDCSTWPKALCNNGLRLLHKTPQTKTAPGCPGAASSPEGRRITPRRSRR